MTITSPDGGTGRPEPPPADLDAVQLRNDLLTAFFSTWVTIGLFVDGWAHNTDRPETFFSPWHALMYSGFAAGMATLGVVGVRDRLRGIAAPDDPLATAGIALFAFGFVADMVWHTVFGIEVDVEALVSPSHLVLMAAGLLLVTAPIRSALAHPGWERTWRTWLPAAVGLTLVTAVASFFGQFASALSGWSFPYDRAEVDELASFGVAAALLPTILLVGALLWVTARWPRPPAGTFTLVFGATALLMTMLASFDGVALAVPVALAGACADVLVHLGVPIRVVATGVPVVLWVAWFATFQVVWGLGWTAELTSGTVALAAFCGYGLASLVPTERPSGPSMVDRGLRSSSGTATRATTSSHAAGRSAPAGSPTRGRPGVDVALPTACADDGASMPGTS